MLTSIKPGGPFGNLEIPLSPITMIVGRNNLGEIGHLLAAVKATDRKITAIKFPENCRHPFDQMELIREWKSNPSAPQIVAWTHSPCMLYDLDFHEVIAVADDGQGRAVAAPFSLHPRLDLSDIMDVADFWCCDNEKWVLDLNR